MHPSTLLARSKLSRRREDTSRPPGVPRSFGLVPEVVPPQPGAAHLCCPQPPCPTGCSCQPRPSTGRARSASSCPPGCRGPFPGLPVPSSGVLRSTFHSATTLMMPVLSLQTFRGCSWREECHSSPCPSGPFLVPCQWNDVPLASFIYSPAPQAHRHGFCSQADGRALPHCFGSQRSPPWSTISPSPVQILLILYPLKWCLPPKVFIVQKSDLPALLLCLTLLLEGLPEKAAICEYASCLPWDGKRPLKVEHG